VVDEALIGTNRCVSHSRRWCDYEDSEKYRETKNGICKEIIY
jgi:hypothetical protein